MQVEHYKTIIKDMNAAGVKMLAGTDTGANPLCWPGWGVHVELQMLVEAGLSEAEALRTATINPAEFLDMADQYGSVSDGKIADLVILNKNPLSRISNTSTIFGVIRRGEFISAEKIGAYMDNIALKQAK